MNLKKVLIILSILIIQVQLRLDPEKRQALLEKIAEKVSYSDFESAFDGIQEDDDHLNLYKRMEYNVSDIQELLNKYNLLENYNYLEENNISPIVKDQGDCGSCWSFATTSSLGYKFNKLGININLSPQDAISCFHPDCDIGIYDIDSNLNIIKNGTVTEECFPYHSSDGTIPECPKECEDKSEFKKYYSQNAYYVENYEQENFYNVALLIMDQIANEGPVIASFTNHDDFFDFGEDKEKCQNDVYSYNGTANAGGNHAVSIVGYGLLNGNYYWLVQNSWGKEWCDNGFIKMDIGEMFDFSFSEPYIKPEKIQPAEIEITFLNINEECYLEVNSSSLDNWNNSLEITFKNEKTSEKMVFYINKNRILDKYVISCNNELMKMYFYLNKGTFKYDGFESLGEYNTFKLNSFEDLSFDFYSLEYIIPLLDNNFYVSQEGSKIVFRHDFGGNDDTVSPVFMDCNAEVPLKNCYPIRTSTFLGYYFGYCEITQDDLDYIQNNEVELAYYYFCGLLDCSGIYLHKLDTEKYPVYEINKFIKPKVDLISNKTDLILVSNLKNKAKISSNKENIFLVLMEIEYELKNETVLVKCSSQANIENIELYATCHIQSEIKYQYQEIYLLPYSIIDSNLNLFEIIINHAIKAEEEPEPEEEEKEEKHDEEKEKEEEEEEEKEEEKEEENEKEKEEKEHNIEGFSSYIEYSLSIILRLLILF